MTLIYAGLMTLLVLFVMSLVIVDETKHKAKRQRRPYE